MPRQTEIIGASLGGQSHAALGALGSPSGFFREEAPASFTLTAVRTPHPRHPGRPHYTQPVRPRGEGIRSDWEAVDRWLAQAMGRRWGADQYILNFGAHYGSCCDDVVSEYMQDDEAEGLAIDHDDPMPWAGDRVATHVGKLRPDEVGALLRNYSVPQQVRLLKVDLDSVDVDLVLAVLRQRTPRFVLVEHQEVVAPPVCYCHRYSAGWTRLGYFSVGCSLQGYVNALRPQGYRLVAALFNDALFVHEALAPAVAVELGEGTLPTAASAYRAGWLAQPWRRLFAQDVPAMEALRSAHNTSARERARLLLRYPPVADAVRKGLADFASDARDGRWPCRPSPNESAALLAPPQPRSRVGAPRSAPRTKPPRASGVLEHVTPRRASRWWSTSPEWIALGLFDVGLALLLVRWMRRPDL